MRSTRYVVRLNLIVFNGAATTVTHYARCVEHRQKPPL